MGRYLLLLYAVFYSFVKVEKLVHNKHMTAQSPVILWLKNVTQDDSWNIGKRASNLGEMLRSEFLLADGFVITSTAYFHFLHDNKLIRKITQLLSTLNYDHPESLMQVSGHIKKLIMESPLSQEFIEEFDQAYRKLGNPPVFVSLSGVLEKE